MIHGWQNKFHQIEWKTSKIYTKPTEPRIITVERGQKGCHSLVRMLENGNYHLVLVGIETPDATWEVSMEVPQEPGTELSYGDSGTSQSGVGSAQHSEVLVMSAQHRKQNHSRYPSTAEWRKRVCIHTVQLHASIKWDLDLSGKVDATKKYYA